MERHLAQTGHHLSLVLKQRRDTPRWRDIQSTEFFDRFRCLQISRMGNTPALSRKYLMSLVLQSIRCAPLRNDLTSSNKVVKPVQKRTTQVIVSKQLLALVDKAATLKQVLLVGKVVLGTWV